MGIRFRKYTFELVEVWANYNNQTADLTLDVV